MKSKYLKKLREEAKKYNFLTKEFVNGCYKYVLYTINPSRGETTRCYYDIDNFELVLRRLTEARRDYILYRCRSKRKSYKRRIVLNY